MAASKPCSTTSPFPGRRLDVTVRGSGQGRGGMPLSNGHGLLLPALLDLKPDKVRQHFRHLCVRLEVLNAEDGEAVVDVAGRAAAGGERSCLRTLARRRGGCSWFMATLGGCGVP